MKKISGHIIGLFLLGCCFSSCEWVKQMIHNEDVVAEVGKYRLYRSALEKAIPDGISPEDSGAVAQQYILDWTRDRIFLDKAESLLSREEQDLSEEWEDYRTTLLKYRYQQRYIAERLDTLVSEEEIAAYYEAQQERFRLDQPIVRGLFYLLPTTEPELDQIRKKLSSNRMEEVIAGDTLCRSVALRLVDAEQRYLDADELSRELGQDLRGALLAPKKGLLSVEDDYGHVALLLVTDALQKGQMAPLSYCASPIKDIILSARKHALAETLERDLLEEARSQNLVTLY